MRIGLFTDTYTPDINGVVSSIVTLRNQLIKDGHDVFVITNHSKLFKYSYDDRVLRVTGLEAKFLYGYTISTPWHLRAYNEIKSMRLDVIHVHTEFGIGIFARICSSRLNIPLVSTYHTTYEDYTHYVNVFDSKTVENVSKKAVAGLSKLYSLSSVIIIAPSLKTKLMLESYGIKREIDVIPSGLNLAAFEHVSSQKRKEIRSQWGFEENQTVFIYVGRIAQEKSIDVVIDAFTQLAKQEENVRLLIVGSGPSEDELKEKVKENHMESTIFFAGKRNADEVPDYYLSCDAFISASLTETQGVTFIEALASGLPVFARPDEPLDEIVIDGETGFYFSDMQEFADKAKFYIQLAQAKKEEIKENCLEIVEPYNSETFSASVLEVYQKAIDFSNDVHSVTSIVDTDEDITLCYGNQYQSGQVILPINYTFKKDLKEGSVLTEKEINELLKVQEIYLSYLKCVKKLSFKDYSVYEMKVYLMDKEGRTLQETQQIIDILSSRHFLDDYRFSQEIIATCKAKLLGRGKMYDALRKHFIDEPVFEPLIQDISDQDEVGRGCQLAVKYASTVHSVSSWELESKVKIKLRRSGYDYSLIEQIVSSADLTPNSEDEYTALQKTIRKGQRLYSRKTGDELNKKLVQYCIRKGYSYEMIQSALKEMELEHEED